MNPPPPIGPDPASVSVNVTIIGSTIAGIVAFAGGIRQVMRWGAWMRDMASAASRVEAIGTRMETLAAESTVSMRDLNLRLDKIEANVDLTMAASEMTAQTVAQLAKRSSS